jgi:hypothetical protein
MRCDIRWWGLAGTRIIGKRTGIPGVTNRGIQKRCEAERVLLRERAII